MDRFPTLSDHTVSNIKNFNSPLSDSDIQEYPSEIHLDFPASWPRGTGWDNLSAHISKLAEAGYLAVKNPIVNKKTHTVAALTDTGRAAFERYREQTMAVLDTD